MKFLGLKQQLVVSLILNNVLLGLLHLVRTARVPKTAATKLMVVTSSNLNRFSTFSPQERELIYQIEIKSNAYYEAL